MSSIFSQPRASKTPRAGWKARVSTSFALVKQELAALVQDSCQPGFVRPFARENLLGRPLTPVERARVEELAAALDAPTLEDALYDIGRALDWTLTADARLWASHPVRDALLEASVRRGLLILTPVTGDEPGEPETDGVALMPRARARHLRTDDWPRFWTVAQAVNALLTQAKPPLTSDEEFDLTRFLLWQMQADAERARLSGRTRFVLSLPLPRPLETRLHGQCAAHLVAPLPAASVCPTPADYAAALSAPRFQAEMLCARFFAGLADAKDAGQNSFRDFVEARLECSAETVWTKPPETECETHVLPV